MFTITRRTPNTLRSFLKIGALALFIILISPLATALLIAGANSEAFASPLEAAAAAGSPSPADLASTAITLSASPSPSDFGAPTSLTATVTPTVATGRVTFYDDVTVLGIAPLSSGTATLSTIALPAGVRTLKAYYSGDTTYAPATSTVVKHTVNAGPANLFSLSGVPGITTAKSVALGDFDGNGKADLVIGVAGGVAVALGNGDGTYGSPVTYQTTASASAVAVGDFNGDGRADIAAGAAGVSILLGNGDGTFQNPASYALSSNVSTIVAADLNGDGVVDLAGGDPYFGFFVLIGRGDGTFEPAATYSTAYPNWLFAADFNGDGKAELGAVKQYRYSVAIFAYKGDRTFEELSDVVAGYPSAPIAPYAAVAADFDGDGIMDMAVTLGSGQIGWNVVAMYLGNGDGTFQKQVNYPTNLPTAVAITAGDFNGDGRQDVAVSNSSRGGVSILLGGGDGTLQPPTTDLAGTVTGQLAAGNLNGDARQDLAVVSNGSGNWVTVLLGQQGTLSASAGTPQSTIAGLAFPTPLQVTVTDSGGHGISGVPVTFSASPDGAGASAALSGAAATTDAAGAASVTATANHIVGKYSVNASVGTQTVSFSLANFLGSITTLKAAGGSPQYTPAGTAFPTPLQALATDAGGNPLSGVSIAFSAPAGGATAALSAPTAVTNASGIASVTAIANGMIGAYSVVASTGALSAPFALGNQGSSSATLSVSPNPSAFGAPVTLTATVAPSASTGKVTFYDGATPLGTASLSSGTASFTTSMLPAGGRRLKAIYQGDPTHAVAVTNAVSLAVNANAGNVFAVGANPQISGGPYSLAAGDFNGDRATDLIIANNNSSGISVLLGNGHGAFTTANIAVASYPLFAAVGDFDGDGNQDLAVTYSNSSSKVGILLGNGDGTFRTAVNYDVGSPASFLAIADMNGDGKIDIAASSQGVTVLLGNGDGTFQAPVAKATAGYYLRIVAGDFDGDGRPDVAAVTSSSNVVSVFLGNGDGTFQNPVDYVVGSSPNWIVAADFNSDGRLDLATANSYGYNISLLTGKGDGSFQSAVAYSLGSDYSYISPSALAASDFNGDGKADLAVTTQDGFLRILTGTGTGTFTQTATYGGGPSLPASIVAGDFDGNGKVDLAVTNSNASNVAVLLGAFVHLTASGTPQSTIAGTPFAAPLQVTAMDGATPVAGIGVGFAAPSSGGASATLSSGTAVTDASGVASVTATANHDTGNYAITATAGPLIVLFQLTNVLGQPVSLTPSNATQFAGIGLAFARPLQVTVKDAGGNVLSGVTVTFTAPASGASAGLSSATAVSDSNGVASVIATANGIVGGYSVKATVGSATATFSLTNQATSGISLSASPSPATFGTPVTLTATVTPSTATGKVTFYDGATVLGTGAVSSGAATIATIQLPAGNRELRALYGGDADYSVASATVKLSVSAVAGNAFAVSSSPSVGREPLSVALGDFNGDGKADFVTANSSDNTVSVLLGNGDGAFQAAKAFGTGSRPDFVTVGDFNGDGKQDLATANFNSNNVSILLGAGDGTFQPAVNCAVGSAPYAIAVGDFDGDGRPDLATANYYSSNVSVLLGIGDGLFQPAVNYSSESSPNLIAAGDFNGDGKTDLAVGFWSGSNVKILLGNGDGTFRAGGAYPSGTYELTALVPVDLNGDGKLDLAGTGDYSGIVFALPGIGDGSFGAAIRSSVANWSNATDMVSADFTGDGKPDLARVPGSQYFQVLPGAGDGSFPAASMYNGGLFAGTARAAAVADFNGDGRADIVLTTSNNSATVFLGAAVTLSQSGTPQTTVAGTAFSQPLQVVAQQNGQPVAGVAVAYFVSAAANGATATLSASSAATDASGVASVTATSNTKLGSYTVTATTGSQSISFALTNVLGPPASITAAHAKQSTAVGAAFAWPLEVTVKDAGGTPLQNVTVTFTAPASGATASLSSATAVTNARGVTSVVATANSALGNYEVVASVGSLTAKFSLTNLEGSSVALAVSPAAATFGAPVVLTATVSPASAFGKVTFWDGVTMIGAASLSSGKASYTTKLLPSGSRKLTAYYVGSAGMAGVRSNTVTASVTAAAANFLKTGTRGTLGPNPRGIAIGDFNGDGKADVAIADSNDNAVKVLLGNGDGTFWTAMSFAAGSNPAGMVAADFDSDGVTDLAVANASSVSILTGNGDGTFGAAVNYPAGGGGALAAADFDGNGVVDIAVVGMSSSAGSILLGNGDGTFQPQLPFNAGGTAYSVAAADFNNDGKADLVAGGSSSDYEVALGNGDGTFQTPVRYAGGYIAYSVATADFDGDGNQDVAGPGLYTSDVSVMLGNGDGTFQDRTTYPLLYEAGWLAQGDFNGDGIIDLATNGIGYSSKNVLVILPGKGDGSFQVAGSYAGGSAYAPIAAADFDGDGRTDVLVTASGSPGGFTVLQGSSVNITTTGAPQTATYGTAFGSPLQVIVKDGATPVAGVTVTFSAPSSGASASLSATSVVTDASGLASVTATANSTVGSYSITAGVASTTASFQLTNAPGSATTLTALNTTQSTAVGTPFLRPLSVTVLDAAGNPLSGVSVTFTAPSSGSTAALSAKTAVTNAAGMASVTAIANSVLGSYAVTASVGSLTASFALSNSTASNVTLSASPNPAAFGAPVVLTASVTPASATGKVTFYDGVTVLGTKQLAGGTASLSTILLPTGDRRLRAYYTGNSTYAPAHSALVVQTVKAAATSTFAPSVSLPPPQYAWAQSNNVLAGDFNGDNIADLAIVRYDTNGVDIHLGRGDGTFRTGASYTGAYAPFLAGIGDFNGDGCQDLVAASRNYYSTVVFLGNCDGTFHSAPQSLAIYASGLVVADFDDDGKADLAVAQGWKMTVLLGKGDATFQAAPDRQLGLSAQTLVAADFNGDGRVDLAAGAGSGSTGLAILLGNGDGTFSISSSVADESLPMAAADFNGDGNADIAAMQGVFPGNGDGTFGNIIPYPRALKIAQVVTGDFNGDGKTDIASAEQGANVVGVFLGNDDGSFQSPVDFPTGAHPYGTAATDFNRDGKPDFAVANADASVSLLLGSSARLLTVAVSHSGSFTQGQKDAAYTITVSNNSLATATEGSVTVTETLPAGLTLVDMAGTGWTCAVASATCTRADALPGGQSYPAITVTVNVAINAASPQLNRTSVSGGGSADASATDSTVITSLPNTLMPGSTSALGGKPFSIPITLKLASGVSAGSLAFSLRITPLAGAPALAGSLAFTPDAAIPAAPTVTANGSDAIDVTWSSLSPALSGAKAVGVVTGTMPAGAAGNQKYTIAITAASAGIGDGAVSLGSLDATLSVTATYLVGDVYPSTNDTAPDFGDGSLDVRDLAPELFAVTNVPGFRPAACSDRLDAMDAYPPDTATMRGGDGSLDIRDLVLELFRTTALDATRPVRASQGGVCGAPTEGFQSSAALARRNPVPRRAAESEGALEVGIPEPLGDGQERAPVYLVASRNLERIAVAFAVGDLQSKLRFTPGPGRRPSLASDTQTGVVAVAWGDGVSAAPGERLLLGYVQGPAGTTAKWEVFGLSASRLNDNREVSLSVRAQRQ